MSLDCENAKHENIDFNWGNVSWGEELINSTPPINEEQINSDIEEIKDSIKNLANIVNQRSISPAYWSISRKEAIEYWNFVENRKEKSPKGWLCDIPYKESSSKDLASLIKSKYSFGFYDISLFDEVGREISRRTLEIPYAFNKSTLVQIGSCLPKHSLVYNDQPAPYFINRDGRDCLVFSSHDNEKAFFSGKLSEDIEGSIKISIYWSTNSWKDGTVEWEVSFQSINADGKFIKYSEICRSRPNANETNFISTLNLDTSEKFLKDSDYKIVVTRCGSSTEDTLSEEVDLFYIMADGYSPAPTRTLLSEKQNEILDLINVNLQEDYASYYYNFYDLTRSIFNRFERTANLRIKGGFVDLNLLSQDLDVDQEFVCKVAAAYLEYQKGFLKGRLIIERHNLTEFGVVYVLKRKRWDWKII